MSRQRNAGSSTFGFRCGGLSGVGPGDQQSFHHGPPGEGFGASG